MSASPVPAAVILPANIAALQPISVLLLLSAFPPAADPIVNFQNVYGAYCGFWKPLRIKRLFIFDSFIFGSSRFHVEKKRARLYIVGLLLLSLRRRPI